MPGFPTAVRRGGLRALVGAEGATRSTSSRRRRTRQIVTAVCVLCALAGALATGEPTGTTILDVLYRAGFAAIVAAATSKSRRWAWFVVAGMAGAAGSGDLIPLGLAGLALAVALGAVVRDQRSRELGAVVGALSAQALLRLPTDLPFAVPTLVAALAPVPVYVSALRVVRRPERYLRPLAAVAAALVVIGVVFVAAMFSIAGRASDGIRDTRQGISAARAGEDDAAEAAFTRAERSLSGASSTADAWWLTPARAVPVLAQHVRAVAAVTDEGHQLAALSADQLATLDITGLSRPGGGFDLERIEALTPRARTVSRALDRAVGAAESARSPWLVAPLQDRVLEFGDEVGAAAPAARNAVDALELAPSLLGAEGPKRYVVLVGNPAEARELGGFVASVGTLTADQGTLRFDGVATGDARAAIQASGVVADVSDLPSPLRASNVNQFPENWTNSVDLRAVAGLTQVLGPAFAGGPVDGVLYLDPYAVAALLQITGPVPIEGREPLAAEQAVDYLMRDQYLSPDFAPGGSRKERLQEAAEGALDRLTTGEIPDPRRVADTLSPVVRARRLLFTTSDGSSHRFLTRLGLRPPADVRTSDQVLVAQVNPRPNKMDAYLQRHIRYDLEVDAAGRASGNVTVELTSTAPPGGLPDYVTGTDGSVPPVNATSVSLYSPFEVVGASVDGAPSGFGMTAFDDLWRTTVRVQVPPQTTVSITYSVEGAVDPGAYSLSLVPNATAGTDTVEAIVDVDGRRLELSRRPLDETLVISP